MKIVRHHFTCRDCGTAWTLCTLALSQPRLAPVCMTCGSPMAYQGHAAGCRCADCAAERPAERPAERLKAEIEG